MTRRRGLLAVGALLALTLAFGLGRASVAAPPPPPGPGAVDVGFAQDMAAHHAQAVLMASLAPGRAGPTVAALAAGILSTQSTELGAMQGWLRLWGAPAASPAPMAWMGHPMAPGDLMPGMATPEDLTDLWAASGPDFDARFLDLMLRHHRGGVEMAGYAAAHAGLGVVRDAARGMQFSQAEEIGQMQAVLGAAGGAGGPPAPIPPG